MEVQELKKLIKNTGSVLVMENGEPSFVVVNYRVYKDLTGNRVDEREVRINHNSNSNSSAKLSYERESEILERLNKDILALKNQIEAEERGLANPYLDPISND